MTLFLALSADFAIRVRKARAQGYLKTGQDDSFAVLSSRLEPEPRKDGGHSHGKDPTVRPETYRDHERPNGQKL